MSGAEKRIPAWLRGPAERLLVEWRKRRELGVNVASLVGERLVRLAVGVTVSSLVARHLGTEDFGQMNLGLALGGIGLCFASLGLDVVLVSEIARRPSRAPMLMRSALVVRSAASALFSVGAAVWLWCSAGRDAGAVLLFALTAWGAVSGIPALWFQAVGKTRGMAVVNLGGFLAASATRLVVVRAGAGLEVLGGVALAELVCAGGAMAWLWRRESGRAPGTSWRRNLAGIRYLLRRGAVWWGAGIFIMVYSRLDQVILHELAGATELGLLAAATRLTEQSHLLPMALAVPMLGRLAASGEGREWSQRVRRYLVASAVVGYLCAAVVWCVGPLVIRTLFGVHFAEAGVVARIQALSLPWIFLGVARGQVLAASGRGGGGALLGAGLGAVAGCVLNVALIPRLGAAGAAWAGVGAQAVASVLSGFATPRWRWLAVMQIRALTVPWRLWRG